MSKQSAPIPIFQITRPEDLSNLNNILMGFAIDERLRIKATGEVTMLKAVNSYNKEESITIVGDYIPAIIAFASTDGTTWFPLPYVDAIGAATLAVNEVIRIKSIVNSGGTTTVTFRIDCDSTDYANAITRYIHYIILKDKAND